ncbi:MAG: flagellar motor protein [Bryobacteraceae bacterium]|nr:flagellar motor protein [Bryobacteraceae bacterium]
MDVGTLAGLAVAFGGILFGQRLEGGEPQQIIQGTAALIVLGGTVGAVLISTPIETVIRALRRLKTVFIEPPGSPEAVIEEIILYAGKARKSGIVSLESETQDIANSFLRKGLNLAVDGADIQEIRKMLELEIQVEESVREAEAKVYETAGGYCPTIGIIGAVLGLIHVMGQLADVERVGEGIASAFVATVYGVGFANLFFLPAANKMKARARLDLQLKELMLEGIIGIVEGLNPKLIRSKLEAYIIDRNSGGAKNRGGPRSAAAELLARG